MNRRQLLASALGCGAASLAPAEAQAPPGTPAEPLELLWSRPLRNLIALAVAADGSRVLAGDLDGHLRCYDASGEVFWEATCPATNQLLCSEGGRLSVAFSLRRPVARRVYFLDAGGRVIYTLETAEAISAAALAADGSQAAIASGKTLTFCSRTSAGMRVRTVQLPAEPFQLRMGPADTVYAAYRNPARVDLVKSTGRVLWSYPAHPGSTVEGISTTRDGKFVAIASHDEKDTIEVALLDWARKRRWTDTRAGRMPRVRICADGGAVLLTYEHKVEHGEQRLFERRLAYLGGPGGGAWTKGGGYTAPRFVSCAEDGSWVVALDRQREAGPARFRLYGRDGGRLWIYDAPTSVLIAVSSLQGRHFAVYCADGTLELVRVNPR